MACQFTYFKINFNIPPSLTEKNNNNDNGPYHLLVLSMHSTICNQIKGFWIFAPTMGSVKYLLDIYPDFVDLNFAYYV